MKKLIALALILVLMTAMLAGCGSDSANRPAKGDTRKILAEKYVDAIMQEDFEALIKFKLTMQMRFSLLTKNEYKKVKGVFTDACGDFIRRVNTLEMQRDPYWIVTVASEFEDTYADINVVFDKNNKIAGIHYLYSRIYEDMGSDEELLLIGEEYPLTGAVAVPSSDGLVPAVIFVHGSGPSDRNEAIGGNAVFLDLAKQLYDRGIASLRYDKRTYVYPDMDYENLTVWEETINDVINAYEVLRLQDGIDPDRIYIAGHSLGGYLMPRIASELPDAAGFIMLAPSASHLEDLIVMQTDYINKSDGNVTNQEKDALAEIEAVRVRIKNLEHGSGYSAAELFYTPESYWLDLKDYTPVDDMKSESRPILILQGGRDYQVTTSEFEIWKAGLSDNNNAKLMMLPELNHMFAYGEEASVPAEYQELATVDTRVSDAMADFILGD